MANIALYQLLNARPTPERLAKVMVYLGIIKPTEISDYDWKSLDYQSYRTVREMILDYCRRQPREPVEGLLIEACQKLRQTKPESVTAGEAFVNEVEQLEAQGYPPEIAVAYTATDPEFLERTGISLEKALRMAVGYAEERGLDLKQLKIDLKRALYYYSRELGIKAGDIPKLLREAFEKPVKVEVRKSLPKLCLRKEIEKYRETMQLELGQKFNAIVGFAYTVASHILRKKHLPPSPEKAPVMAGEEIPILVVYWALTDNPRVYELACIKPKYVMKVLGDFSKIAKFLTQVRAGKNVYTLSEKDALSLMARAILLSAKDMIRKLRETNVRVSGVSEQEWRKMMSDKIRSIYAKAEELLKIADEFVPGVYSMYLDELRNIIAEQTEYNLRVPPENMMKVPSLQETPTEILATIENALMGAGSEREAEERLSRILTPKQLTLLKEYGLRVDGEVRLYKDHLLHLVEAVNIPGYGWINLTHYNIFLWYDPLTGRLYLEESRYGKNYLKQVTYPEFLNWLMKKLTIRIPTGTVPPVGRTFQSGVPPYEQLTGEEREKILRKLMESVPKEAPPVEEEIPPGIELPKAPAVPQAPPEKPKNWIEEIEEIYGSTLKDFEWAWQTAIKYFPDVVQEIVKHNPKPLTNLKEFLIAIDSIRLAKLSKYIPGCAPTIKTVKEAIEFLRKHGILPTSPNFGTNMIREMSSYTNYCSFVEPLY